MNNEMILSKPTIITQDFIKTRTYGKKILSKTQF